MAIHVWSHEKYSKTVFHSPPFPLPCKQSNETLKWKEKVIMNEKIHTPRTAHS